MCQIEWLLEVKCIVDHKSVKSGISFIASLFYAFIWTFFGIPSVQQAYSVIISYIANTEKIESVYVKRFLIDFNENEANHYKRNKLTRFRSKNREQFIKAVCKAKSLDFIFEKNKVWSYKIFRAKNLNMVIVISWSFYANDYFCNWKQILFFQCTSFCRNK